MDYPGELLLLDEDEFFGLYEFDEVGICIPTGEQYLAPLLKDLHAGTAVDYLSPYVLYLFCQDWLASKDSGWPETSPGWPNADCENFDSFVLDYLGEDKLVELKQVPIFGPGGDQFYLSVVKQTLLDFMATWFPEGLECLNSQSEALKDCLQTTRNWLQSFTSTGHCGGLPTDYCTAQGLICDCVDFGDCGLCSAGQVCFDGSCCTLNCEDGECKKPDGCGGECLCPGSQDTCIAGKCVCIPECFGKECGPDGCGGICGICPPGHYCANGACECIPSCEGKECGGDGCGGSCGECEEDIPCVNGVCCEPDCVGKQCGYDDGCGGVCQGWCPGEQEVCQDGVCECQPDCFGKECGPDGCGDTCGSCPQGYYCVDGQCACMPQCAGKDCGDDGCGGSCGDCGELEWCHKGECIPLCLEYENQELNLDGWSNEELAWRALEALKHCLGTCTYKNYPASIVGLSIHLDGVKSGPCNEDGVILGVSYTTTSNQAWQSGQTPLTGYCCSCANAYDQLVKKIPDLFGGNLDAANAFLTKQRDDPANPLYFFLEDVL